MLKNEESAILQYSIKNIEIGQIFPIIDSSKVGGVKELKNIENHIFTT